MSDSRWRQIIKGYRQETADIRVPVRAPAETLARMADVVGATPDQLREVGREDAADELESLGLNARTYTTAQIAGEGYGVLAAAAQEASPLPRRSTPSVSDGQDQHSLADAAINRLFGRLRRLSPQNIVRLDREIDRMLDEQARIDDAMKRIIELSDYDPVGDEPQKVIEAARNAEKAFADVLYKSFSGKLSADDVDVLAAYAAAVNRRVHSLEDDLLDEDSLFYEFSPTDEDLAEVRTIVERVDRVTGPLARAVRQGGDVVRRVRALRNILAHDRKAIPDLTIDQVMEIIGPPFVADTVSLSYAERLGVADIIRLYNAHRPQQDRIAFKAMWDAGYRSEHADLIRQAFNHAHNTTRGGSKFWKVVAEQLGGTYDGFGWRLDPAPDVSDYDLVARTRDPRIAPGDPGAYDEPGMPADPEGPETGA